jgi:gamma-glutamyltranspeptidase
VKRTESFYDRWFSWRFDDYYFCAANDECEYNFSMQEAVNAPRFHHQWLPDLITFDNTFNTQTFDTLKQKAISSMKK